MKSTSKWMLAAWTSAAVAQLSGWQDDQINATICTWEQPRAALIRDTIYIDGGELVWSAGLSDGQIGNVRSEANFAGTVFTLNLTNGFSKSDNISGLFVKDTESKSRGGRTGASPYFIDGAMLHNDAEYFVYGGAMFRNQKLYKDPDGSFVESYQAYQYGDDKALWQKGFYDRDLGDDVNRYVAYGGGASAPSEQKAWYLFGMTSETNGPIYTIDTKEKKNWAYVESDRMITLDMTEQNNEKWSNDTIPDKVKKRANPEVVWVPVGEEGILVVLGGVTYPQWAWTEKSKQSDDEEKSKKESPAFMENIDIYDIKNNKWYQQPTKDGPGARTRGCAVLATASDQSSFNIYYYGGFDGLDFRADFSDEVWVLSMPSFTWTKLNDGKAIHGRSGHKCVTPYEDQMFAIGGYVPLAGAGTRDCLVDPVVMFNLTSGEWLDEYDPEKHDDYGVPDKVVDTIGGSAAGGAEMTEPSPSWASKELGELFDTQYDMEKIKSYGPFDSAESSSRPELPNNGDDNGDDDDGGGGGGGLPSWVAPVLGVVIGLIVLTTVLVLFCLWRRRKMLKTRGSSTAGTEDAGMRIMSWMRGQQPGNPEKAATVTSSEEAPTVSPDPRSPHMSHVMGVSSIGTTTPGTEPPPGRAEVDNNMIYEIADTSPPPPAAELADDQLSHNEVLMKHSRLHNSNNPSSFSPHTHGSFSFAAGASTISHSSGAAGSSAPLGGNRADVVTPELDATHTGRVTSDVSGISQAEAGHLRHLSETSIDGTVAGDQGPFRSAASSPPTAAPPAGAELPVSPPTAHPEGAEAAAQARQQNASPLRRSVFVENEADMKKD